MISVHEYMSNLARINKPETTRFSIINISHKDLIKEKCEAIITYIN